MGREIEFTMTPPQFDFFQLQDKYPAFVGGFGTGKTETLANCAVRDALASADALIALYEPTYDLIRLILAPRMEEKLSALGIRYKYNKTENIIYTSTGGCGDFVLRTLDNPARIIGYESYRSHVDELDTLKQEHAQHAWQKIIARNRQKPNHVDKPFNRVSVYTTPEGFRFVYHTWARDPKPGYVMIQAETRSNPFLPEDYVQSLIDSYPPQLIEAYLKGQFVNLTSGAVYPEFSRSLNHIDAELLPGEPLHVGMDFNVSNMAAALCVIRNNQPIVVGELTKVRDTPQMAQILRERYLMTGHSVYVYPDASGASRKTNNASVSDLILLEQAGLKVFAKPSNPAVRDRINSVNGSILSASGARNLRVNTRLAPTITESLEQQVYAVNGEPDKASGLDHINDALGYFIFWHWPVVAELIKQRAMAHMGR